MRRTWDPIALVRAADDAQLRVYADWLEQDKGDAGRAQLIHAQCERAGLAAWERRAEELDWEIVALLAEHGARIRDELPVYPGVRWTDIDRGFVVGARVADVDTLGRYADDLGRVAPIECIEFAKLDGRLPAEVEVPWLRRVRLASTFARDLDPHVFANVVEIEVTARTAGDLGWLIGSGPRRRAKEAPAPRLRSLVLPRGSDNDTAFAPAIGGAPWAPSLERLEMPSAYVDDNTGYGEDPRLGPPGARALGKLAGLARLDVDRQRVGSLGPVIDALPALRALSGRENGCKKLALAKSGAPLVDLDLGQNAIGSAGLRALLAAKRCAALERLVLDTCEIESLGIEDLIRAPAWQTLRRLDLSRNPLGASAIRAFASAAPPGKLHALLVADADLDESAAQELAKVPWLGALQTLDLSGNRLARGATALRSIPPDALRSLGLAATGIERAEAAAIARFWPRLVELDVSTNHLTDAGLERFAAMKEAAGLQTLALRDCKLTGDGAELLANARTPRLRDLDLGGNALGPAVGPLLASPALRQLERLSLAGCGVATVTAVLSAQLPPRLAHLDLRGNELDEATLVALAKAPALRAVPEIRLDGQPWTYTPASRDLLNERFGPNWQLGE